MNLEDLEVPRNRSFLAPPYPEMLQLDVVKVESDGDVYDYESYVNGTIVIESEGSSLTADTTLEITPEQSLGPF